MPSTCRCPSCARLLALPDDALGQQVQCPSCNTVFVAGASGPSVAPARPLPPSPRPFPPPAPRPPSQQPVPDFPARGERWAAGDEEEDYHRAAPRVRATTATGKATAATVFLGLAIVSSIAGILVDLQQLRVLELHRQNRLTPEEENVAQVLAGLSGLFGLAVMIGAIISICMWIYQAHTNLDAWGVSGRRFTPGWAVGYFFIPILNLFKPYQAMQELWKASDPDDAAVPDPHGWKDRPGSGPIGFWWAVWLISNIIGNIAARTAFERNPTFEDLTRSLWASIISEGLAVVAAVLLISIIQAVQGRQRRKQALLSQAEGYDTPY